MNKPRDAVNTLSGQFFINLSSNKDLVSHQKDQISECQWIDAENDRGCADMQSPSFSVTN